MNEQEDNKTVDLIDIHTEEIIPNAFRVNVIPRDISRNGSAGNIQNLIAQCKWCRCEDGKITFYHPSEFREKPKKRWVNVTHECEIDEIGSILHKGSFTQCKPYRRRIEWVGVFEKDAKIIIEKEMEQ